MMEYTNPNEPWMKSAYKGMTDKERLKAGCFQCAATVVIIIVGLALCALMGSCTTTEYVTVEKVRTDTLRQYRNVHDSIYVHDSVSVKENGDTVRIEKWHTKYIEHEVHDTVYHATHDTIPQPYPVIHEVERKLTRREQTMMSIGALAIFAAVCWLILYTVKILRRFGILNI